MVELRDPGSGLVVVELEPLRPQRKLAVVLHGRGASKEDLLDLGQVLAREGWSVVLPDAPLAWGAGFAWYETESRSRDLPKARDLVTKLVRSRSEGLKLSRENVLLCGFSQGGVTSLDVALHSPQLVARVACLSGYLSVEDAPPRTRVAQGLDVFIGHGSEDPLIVLDRAFETRDELEARGVRVRFHDYEMAHSICSAEVEHLRRWLGS